MAKQDLRIGMIGYGFMGRAHSNAYCQVSHFFDTQAQAGAQGRLRPRRGEGEGVRRPVGLRVDRDRLAEAGRSQGHRRGRHLRAEQPARRDRHRGGQERQDDPVRKAAGDELRRRARRWSRPSRRPTSPNMVWYNYRRIPAVTLAKRLIDEGRLGKIFHYRAKFLQDWTIKADLPQGGQGLWRLDLAAAGAGVSGDLLAHCIDTAIWLNGRMDTVCCMTETFVKERMHNLTGKVEKVGIDDACIFFGKFANGSLANFESTRYARGHKALYTFEINGENMSLAWDLHDLHRLQVFDYKDEGKIRGWKSVHVTDNSPDHPYMDKWWVPGLAIGYDASFTHQVADFLTGIETGKPAVADVPRCPGNAADPGRDPGIGEDAEVGECGEGLNLYLRHCSQVARLFLMPDGLGRVRHGCRMHIVHLTASAFFGGPERQMLGLATALPASYSSTFLSFSEGGRCQPFLAAAQGGRVRCGRTCGTILPICRRRSAN